MPAKTAAGGGTHRSTSQVAIPSMTNVTQRSGRGAADQPPGPHTRLPRLLPDQVRRDQPARTGARTSTRGPTARSYLWQREHAGDLRSPSARFAPPRTGNVHHVSEAQMMRIEAWVALDGSAARELTQLGPG